MVLVHVAALQPALPHEMKPIDRLEKQLRMCREAVRFGAEYIFFPEFFLGVGYVVNLGKGSEELRRLQSFAEEQGVWLGINVVTRVDEDSKTVHNSVVLIDQKGENAAVYDKVRPYTAWEPVSIASLGFKLKLGGRPLVYDTGKCKVGLAQCIDMWVSTFMKELSYMGAELVYVPSRMPLPHFLSTQVFARVRAMENCYYVVVVGEAGRTMPGTLMAGPRLGNVEMDLSSIGCDEAIVHRRIDLDWLRRQRSLRNPLFQVRAEEEKSLKARLTETDWTNRWYEGADLEEFITEMCRLGLMEGT